VGMRRWLTVPLVGALGVLIILKAEWILMAQVKLSEGRLRSYVASVAPGTIDQTSRWVGLIRIEETEGYEGAVYLYTGTIFLNRVGVAYMPEGTQPAGRIRVDHLYGPWYWFEWRF